MADTSSVAQRIVGVIRDLGLQPGDAMPTELDLIERLQLSRNTVREAIRELRAWGIVDVRHGHGTFVAEASLGAIAPSLVFRALVAGPDGLASLRHLVDVRELIESGVIGTLAGTFSDTEISELLALCDTMADPDRSEQADRAFHRALYRRLDNPLVGQLVDVFWDAYHEAHHQLADLSSYGDETAELHRDIVTALRDGDAAAAQHAMHVHFGGIGHRLDLAKTRA
jgi:DNA-binding FadR family transcriptional regulator